LQLLRDNQLELGPQTLVVVDEAAMVGTTDLRELLTATTAAGAKTVLVGDAHQLAPVKARGGMFAQLCTDLPWTQHLSQVWRMRNPDERDASLALRDGHGNRLPRRFAAEFGEVRSREIALAAGVEQVLDAVEVEEGGIAAGAGGERDVTGGGDIRLRSERHLDIGEDLLANRLRRTGLFTAGHEHVDRLPAVHWGGEHETERDVVNEVTVGVDRQPIDGIGVQRVGVWIGVEDQHGPLAVGRRLERVQIAQVKALIAKRRSETQTGEMVGHVTSPYEPFDADEMLAFDGEPVTFGASGYWTL